MAQAHTHGKVKRDDEGLPKRADRRERDGPDRPRYEDPVEGRRVPARPGTPQTGLPDIDDLGKMDRADLKALAGGNEQADEPAEGPAHEEAGRLDRREFAGWRGDRDERGTRHEKAGARGVAQGHREQR